ncbi:hypothetical protein [Chamaesiphon sp.]|uniref:plasmid mobilization protein n=1 Tax=Chamaesiphon sp. TaxID=2814140 RepID=UPI0035941C09
MTELENRSNRLTIRFTDSERTTLRTTAEKLRLSEGEYGRKRILSKGEIKQIVIPQVNQDTCLQLTRLQVELNRQGVNLNQLLKLLHSRQASSETINQVATLMEVYKETKATVDTYQSQLIRAC